ncbi:molybdopterin oxidoreductase family protein [Pontivivens ytuae]|uniref:Molybdopterin oxidoreductase family protein n=1 Tax=Pontivivens ytuae TaxID=2789856 RepID=A0A7S9LRC2_9RHOB|nr:molybdopterin oxidoreductase family protein [Pontivivens ytuae]QPH53864.1 molybdopterin oxidoreductase family protein [Pontivivens ytuae]
MAQAEVDLTPVVADEVKYTTCYMCACRCGIRVHLKGSAIRYIDGNPDHPVNKGVLCAKGSAGLMNHYSQARLSKPLKRVGPRGSGEFEEIEWDEALALATDWLGEVRQKDPKKLAFFTGRDQSQSLTGWWAAQFGTINFAAHGGFCSVNMAAAGLYTLGGAFWEFGEPDWDRTEYFLMFGVAEDHDSNPIKTGLGKIKTRGAKFVSVNPCRTGYSAIADEWVPIRPGTDGLLVFSLIRELLLAEKVDWEFLVRYTNAHWLVIDAPGDADHGLFAREDGAPLCLTRGGVEPCAPGVEPVLTGRAELADGRTSVPAFELFARRFLSDEYAPEKVAETCGVEPAQIRRIAAELAEAAFEKEITLDVAWEDWTGRKHDTITGRPVSMHAMRGISAHANGFHTCRAIHLLQMILGSVDCPGGWRMKAPYPKPAPPGPKPARPARAGEPLAGMPLGNPTGPEDLLVDSAGEPLRIDKAYSWEHPLSSHGLMHMVMHNAWAGDPYPVDVLFMYMANMGWNSAMNPGAAMTYLTDKDENGEYRIPKVIYSDAFWSETVPYADLVLPDTTYLERWDCISLLDRPISSAEGAADAIRHPVVEPDRDVRPFQTVLLDLGARLGLPGMVTPDGAPQYPGGYPDYIVNHERGAALGPLAGWRGNGEDHGRGAPNPNQLDRYIENGGFWQEHLPLEAQFNKAHNAAYLAHAARMGFIPEAAPIPYQLYSEVLQRFRLAADQAPERHRERVRTYFDPLPIWYAPEEAEGDYPLHALTQRPMHMYHSWGSQNVWLRQITAQNRLFIHRDLAAEIGVGDEDWVKVTSPDGELKCQVKLVTGVNRDTVWTWNAIGKRKGAWGLSQGAPEAEKGFLLNHVISELLPPREGGQRYSNSDPVTGQAAWFDLRVRIEKCAPGLSPTFEPMEHPAKMPDPSGHGAKVVPTESVGEAVPFREWLSTKERFE